MGRPCLMNDLPAQEKPRERLLLVGAEKLKPEELIAILLRTGTKGVSVLHVAEELLGRFGHSLDRLSRASIDDLRQIKGIGRDKAVTLLAAFTLAAKMQQDKGHEAPLLDTPDLVVDLLRDLNRQKRVEQLQVVLLNTRRRLIGIREISDGTLDTLLVHPREVFEPAIKAGAAAVVLVHNHPSGDPTPSEADIKVTRDLIRAGQVLKIEVLDHVILGSPSPERSKDYVSLRELGYFYS